MHRSFLLALCLVANVADARSGEAAGPAWAAPVEETPLARIIDAAEAEEPEALKRWMTTRTPGIWGAAARARIRLLHAQGELAAAQRAAVEAGFITRWGRTETSDPRWAAPFGAAQLVEHAAVPTRARASLSIADGGTYVLHVTASAPWVLWMAGRAVGAGGGRRGRSSEAPVRLTLAPGAHHLELELSRAGAVFAARLAHPDGRPVVITPAGVTEPAAPRLPALPGHAAPMRAPLFGATDPVFDLPLPARPSRARPADIDFGPLTRPEPPQRAGPPGWWVVGDRATLQVDQRGAARLSRQVTVVAGPGGAQSWPLAEPAAPTSIAIRPLGPAAGVRLPSAPRGAPAPGAGVVVEWVEQTSQPKSWRLEPTPALHGRWSVRVEGSADRVAIAPAPKMMGAVRAVGADLIWRFEGDVDPSTAGLMLRASTWPDTSAMLRAMAQALDDRPAGAWVSASIESTLASERRASSAGDGRVLRALREAGHQPQVAFVRIGQASVPTPEDWSRPLFWVPEVGRWVDPRSPDGTLDPLLAGRLALRVDATGRVDEVTIPIAASATHQLEVVATVDLQPDGAVISWRSARRGQPTSSAIEPAVLRRPGARAISSNGALESWQVPGWPLGGLPVDVVAPGLDRARTPQTVEATVELRLLEPGQVRIPADVDLEGPAGRYTRRSQRTPDGWRIVRTIRVPASSVGVEPAVSDRFFERVARSEAAVVAVEWAR